MHRQFLLNLLEQHKPYDSIEADMLARTIAFVRENSNCFDRELQQGHITGSAWLVNPARSHVFFTHHKKLQRWFQPGGHSDGDPNTLAVSMREASEESGIEDVFIQPVDNMIFDVDVHIIPQRKNEPEHYHYDIRFLLEADDSQPLRISNESSDIAWVAIGKIPEISQEISIGRMLEKTRRLF